MNWAERVSPLVRSIPPSGIRRFFDIVAEMSGVISLGVGEPDFVTPWHIRESCVHGLQRGYTSYTSNYGLLELRQEITRMIETDYGVTDPGILSAIRCHTTGRVGMLPLDMVLFLADKIEPSRRSYPALETVRKLAQQSLVAATLSSMRSTQAYVARQNATPHPSTQRVIRWLERLPSERVENQRRDRPDGSETDRAESSRSPV